MVAKSEADTAAAQATGNTHTSDSRYSDVRIKEDIGSGEAWTANMKAMFDRHASYDHEGDGQRRAHFDRMMTQAIDRDNQMHALVMQNLQGGVTHKHDLDTQKIRHNDLAVDRQWNVDEVAELVAKTPVLLDAIAAKVVDMIKPAEPKQ